MLLLVIVGSSLTLVLSLNSGSLSVAILEVGIDVLGDSINLLLKRGKTLDPKFKND